MATEDVQTNLRIPADLKERLQKTAEASGRSLSAEVAYRVARAYELEEGLEQASALSEVLRQQVAEFRENFSRRELQHKSALEKIASLEAEARLLKSTRKSDIAAATQFLSERVDFLASRAGAAEREAATVTDAMKAQLLQSERSLERAARAEAEVELLKRKLTEREAEAVNLMPTVVRLERDVARAELAAESYRYKMGFVSQALFALTNAMPPKARLPGDPHSMTAGDWRDFSAAMAKEAEGVASRLTKLVEEVKQLEERVQGREPTIAEIKAHLPSWAEVADDLAALDSSGASEHSEGRTTKLIRRTRKPEQASAEEGADALVRKRLVGNLGSAEESAYEKVIVRATPLKPKPTSKGPVPSPNARKPKP